MTIKLERRKKKANQPRGDSHPVDEQHSGQGGTPSPKNREPQTSLSFPNSDWLCRKLPNKNLETDKIASRKSACQFGRFQSHSTPNLQAETESVLSPEFTGSFLMLRGSLFCSLGAKARGEITSFPITQSNYILLTWTSGSLLLSLLMFSKCYQFWEDQLLLKS